MDGGSFLGLHVLNTDVVLTGWLVRAEKVAESAARWAHQLVLLHDFDCGKLFRIQLRCDVRRVNRHLLGLGLLRRGIASTVNSRF